MGVLGSPAAHNDDIDVEMTLQGDERPQPVIADRKTSPSTSTTSTVQSRGNGGVPRGYKTPARDRPVAFQLVLNEAETPHSTSSQRELTSTTQPGIAIESYTGHNPQPSGCRMVTPDTTEPTPPPAGREVKVSNSVFHLHCGRQSLSCKCNCRR